MSVQTFDSHTGIAAAMLQPNIDTDAIMPSREMRRVSRLGLGDGLFAGWRYLDRGTDGERENPEFVLNQAAYRNSSIILAGRNMGCGSSREFAVWALVDYGIRAIVAPSFGAIFRKNCIRNGVLPVTLDESRIAIIVDQTRVDPQRHKVKIDLLEKYVQAPGGQRFPFEMDAAERQMMIEGMDLIDLTMKSIDEIDEYEKEHRLKRSWMNLSCNRV